ncbi:hypothetical protein NDU88_005972 [Pleurodeles waltl]|uniref:Uncharacterized protein n=1 Tax=Pleurodeles waltl TaxID=8319 RepID=A0AAV7WW83_PLEWA|nr:hypothetical protein NDU88_005972 [Pleurodeles waltl]
MSRDSMLLDIQAGTVRFPYIPSQPVRSVIRWVIYDVIVAVAGLAEIVRTLPYALKISIAPKAARNSEDKSDGSKATRTGRDKGDKGDLVGVNRRPHRRQEGGPFAEKEQPQAQPQAQRTEDLTRVGAASAPSAPSATSSIEEQRMGPLNPKGVGKITEKDLKISDWAKDSSNKFCSLTEESDISSGEHSLSETGSSETSETGNKSSNN